MEARKRGWSCLVARFLGLDQATLTWRWAAPMPYMAPSAIVLTTAHLAPSVAVQVNDAGLAMLTKFDRHPASEPRRADCHVRIGSILMRGKEQTHDGRCSILGAAT